MGNNQHHSKTFIEEIGLSIPLSQWKTESLPTTSFKALFERASASLLWDLEMWWKLMSAKVFDSSIDFSFQLSLWTVWSLDFWEIQSMITRESPRTWRWLIDQQEARKREAHKPKSSTLLLVPAPQFKNHLVILDGWFLKKPPAPQQTPFDWAAPSKQARV